MFIKNNELDIGFNMDNVHNYVEKFIRTFNMAGYEKKLGIAENYFIHMY